MATRPYSAELLACACLVAMAIALPHISAADVSFREPPTRINDTPGGNFDIGDVDLDGDLDLIFVTISPDANKTSARLQGESFHELLLNNGSEFTVYENWSPVDPPPEFEGAMTVVLADIEGDGDLDAVIGRGSGHPPWLGSDSLHLNEDGELSEDVSWVQNTDGDSGDLLIGAVDGDSYLDLVILKNGESNAGAVNSLFRGQPGTPGSSATFTASGWASQESRSRKGILVDLNGDGYLDLVCANFPGHSEHKQPGELPTIHLGDGSSFSSTPDWFAPAIGRGFLAGDMDGSGTLDLLYVDFSAPSVGNLGTLMLYRNDGGGGQFSLDGPFEALSERILHPTAAGDVDLDGDIDVVAIGESAGPTQRELIVLLNGGYGTFEVGWRSQTFRTPDNIDQSKVRVRLADMDGDADLDIVTIHDQGRFIYWNTTPPYDIAPETIGTTADNTTAVVVADLNADGFPDLTFGGVSGDLEMYISEAGTISEVISYSLIPSQVPNVMVIGELGGLLKRQALVVGGSQGVQAVLDWTPPAPTGVWQPCPGPFGALCEYNDYDISSIAIAYVDGDTLNDLAVGARGSPNVVFFGGGTIGLPDTTAAWQTAQSLDTRSIVVGDVDNDGTVDLISANGDGVINVYSNVRRGGRDLPSQSIRVGIRTQLRDIVLGDLDGDGDDDLVCGVHAGGDIAFRNDAGFFVRSWSSQDGYDTERVLLRDAESDGDLDIFCLQDGPEGSLQVYLNEDGDFDGKPSWILDTQVTDSQAVELTDLDRDSDLDLVVANFGENALYRSRLRPLFKGNPADPKNHMVNNSAFLTGVSARSISENTIEVQVTAVDLESDPVWIYPQYQFAGEGEWKPLLDDDPKLNRRGPFDASPEGDPSTFRWEIQEFPFDSRDVVVRLSTISHPRTAGKTQHVDNYDLPFGRVVPVRPEIALPDQLVFPSVTVGDTVLVDVIIINQGSASLDVSDVQPSIGEITSSAIVPTSIPAGQSLTMPLLLAPTEEIEGSVELAVFSSDPLRPEATVTILLDVHALEFDTTLLSSFDPLPLGEAVTVVVRPDPFVRIEQGSLFFRTTGASNFTEVPLTRQQQEFVGIIPGAGVTELGLEYYVRVENSGVFAFDPPPDAPDAWYSRSISAPDSISLLPQSGESGYVEGRGIPVDIVLPTGAQLSNGSLFFRQGGTSEYDSVTVVPSPLGYQGTIPSSATGPRGIEYWVRVESQSGTVVTEPRIDPAASPYTLQVKVPNLLEADTWSGKRYRLMSIPLEFKAEGRTLEDLLSDQPEFGPYDPVHWRAYRYLASSGIVELSEEAAASFRPFPGNSFWLISRIEHRVDTRPLEGLSTPTEVPWQLHLDPGWNQIGNPFAFPVDWEQVGRSSDVSVPYAFDPGLGTLGGWAEDTPRVLSPFEGYFVHNASAIAETLWVPPDEADSLLVSKKPLQVSIDWQVRIEANGAESSGTSCVMGVAALAGNTFDAADRLRPPSPPGEWTTVSIDNATWEEHRGVYSRDFRAGTTDGHRWDLAVVSSQPHERVELQARVSDLPVGYSVRMVDLEHGSSINRGALETGYTIIGRGKHRAYQLAVLVGSRAYLEESSSALVDLPRRVVLDQNIPNPFNPVTKIRFGLPHPQVVTLQIFNVRGELVATPIDGRIYPGGYHTVLWTGRDQRGESAASGVYLYRLQAGTQTKMRRMVLLK